MALAKKCDICGALYEPYELNAVDGANGISIERINGYNDLPATTIKTMDCCVSCMIKILDFIDELREGTK